MKQIHKILVPVDFSEHSQRALDEAIGLAKAFGAELHLLHCYPLHHVLLGSITERAIRIAPCPVLTVKHVATD